jgi:hypothetical protein
VWLEVEVDAEVLSPRREIVSVPFAFRALDSDSLGGYGPGDYVLSGETGTISGEMITDGEISDSDIAPDAGIDPAKIAGGAWTSDNDGTESGLDADMVDGLHADAFADSGHVHDDRYYRKEELNTPGTLNAGDNPVDWTKLKGVPADFADGVDDVGGGAADGHSLDAADGSPVDVVYVNNAGDVGINTTSPGEDLDIIGNIQATGTIKSGNSITLDGISTRLVADSTFEIRVEGVHAIRFKHAAESPNVIGGFSGNDAPDGVGAATISGGGEHTYTNTVTDDFGTVGGGRNNRAGDNGGTTEDARFATVGGGAGNVAGADHATVGGGSQNEAGGKYSTVAGGSNCSTGADYATVGGGWSNTADYDYVTICGGKSNTADQGYASIGGGYGNRAEYYATVGGGMGNNAANNAAVVGGGWSNSATGQYATVSGGEFNTATYCATVAGGSYNAATRMYSTIGGGARDSSFGYYATIPGGADNKADGDYSLAAGRRAKALHEGAFVWADATDADFASTDSNQFLIRASGGVGIGEADPKSDLVINSNIPFAAPSAPLASLTIGNPLGGSVITLGNDASSKVSLGWTPEEYLRVLSTHGIRFGTGPYGPGTYTDVVIAENGWVGIGTESPGRDLHVVGDNPRILIEAETVSPEINFKHSGDVDTEVWAIYKEGTTNDLRFYHGGSNKIWIRGGTGNVGIGGDPSASKLYVNGLACGTSSWGICSDRKFKRDIQNVTGAIEKVMGLRGISFLWRSEEYEDKNFDTGRHYGVVAQEIEEVLPEVVMGEPGDDKSVAYSEIIPVLIEAIKELKIENDELRRRVEALEG